MMINTPENINIFIAYTQEDRPFLEELEIHLSVLERLGMVDKIWYDGLVEAGANWEESVLHALRNADIVLLLVSADFMASNFCYDQEMKQAVQLHEAGRVKTVPIILRPCLWDRAPFAKLKVLPPNGVPVSSKGWEHEDEPYVQIIREIETLILQIKKEVILGDDHKRMSEFNRSVEEAEHYFAAGKWQESQAKFLQALHFSKSDTATDLTIIDRRLEQCKNEIYFQRNFSRGEKAYEEEKYQEAHSALTQALVFKPQDTEAQKLKTAVEAAMSTKGSDENQKSNDAPQGTRFLQVKILGIEIFKVVIALCLIGLVAIPALMMFQKGNDLIASVDAGRVVYLDESGQRVLETEYPAGKNFSEGLAPVQNQEGKWGFIDEENNKKIAFDYDQAWPHSPAENLAYVRKGDKCGFIDLQGELRIPLTYLDAAPFSEGLAMVKKKEGDFAFIDGSGREVISQLDSVITPAFKNGEAIVIQNGRQITIDKKGICLEGCTPIKDIPTLSDKKRLLEAKKIIEASEKLKREQEYDRALMKLKEASKLVIDPDKKEELGNQMDALERKISNLDGTKYQRLIREAEALFQLGDFLKAKKIYDEALTLNVVNKQLANKRSTLCATYIQKENNAIDRLYGFVHPNGLWGVKNQDRAVIQPPQFDSVGVFANGYLAIKEDQLWGFLDVKGNVAVKPFYNKVAPFSPQGFAVVTKNGKTMRIDGYGREVRSRRN